MTATECDDCFLLTARAAERQGVVLTAESPRYMCPVHAVDISESMSLLESLAALATRFSDSCWESNVLRGVCLFDKNHDGRHAWEVEGNP